MYHDYICHHSALYITKIVPIQLNVRHVVEESATILCLDHITWLYTIHGLPLIILHLCQDKYNKCNKTCTNTILPQLLRTEHFS